MIGAPTFIARSKDSEILSEDENRSPINLAPSSNYPIAEILLILHREIGAPVLLEFIEFLKRAVIEQELDSLAGRHLPLDMLTSDTLRSTARLGRLIPFLQCLQFLDDFHSLESPAAGCATTRRAGRASIGPHARCEFTA